MELTDRVVIVTGGGSGIGAAMCRRFATESPRAIVVADLDGVAAAAVADQIRARAAASVRVVARALDVAEESQIGAIVAETHLEHGAVDLFCSNAGIATGMGVEAPDEVWEQIWHVNVMAHVYAARALLGNWLAGGEGHLLVTASAAGLLTNLGDAPYSVTKHAAVALAEWLSVTYGDRGLHVSCLCPQGVRTPLLFGADGASGVDSGLAAEVVKAQRVIEPEEVADTVVAALADDRFLILPRPEVADYERARAGDRERWLGAMRRLQARITGG
ncbi:MAG: SDR family NAD(P)-dependent oxidoreductase [Actinobacteria bacterium]|nr:SDR family NAD(P)-dependent oxidoreductase [Actinomycetota bacterium]